MPKILVVEDNRDIQALLQAVLVPTYSLTQAFEGSQALVLLQQERFDLVILDLMLPGVPGESVLKTLRRTSSVPVLVLTAILDKAHIAAVLDAGANDYLTKPFDIDELQARVRVQLRDTAVEAAALVAGGLRLVPTQRTATLEGEPLELARKEFDLLAILIAHPHQVFAKDALYEAVWHEPYLGAENTLNVHLSHLRSKLNGGERQYITAVWGIGVRLL